MTERPLQGRGLRLTTPVPRPSAWAGRGGLSGRTRRAVRGQCVMSVIIVLGAMGVHLVNGPFRAGNPFTMNAVFLRWTPFPRPSAWADGSGLSGRTRRVVRGHYVISVIIVVGAMSVHVVNGPFRAGNPFTMDAVFYDGRRFPGLTAWADGSGLSGRTRRAVRGQCVMSVIIVLGAMWVHLVNGPFRAGNPFTMDAVFLR